VNKHGLAAVALTLASRYVLAAILVIIGFGSPRAQADVIWNYVGTALNNCDTSPSCLPSTDYLKLSVTFNAPLANNLTVFDTTPTITSYSLTDAAGLINFSLATSTAIGAGFTVNSSGNIVGPYYFITTNNPSPPIHRVTLRSVATLPRIFIG
jgi:hypothetical protein